MTRVRKVYVCKHTILPSARQVDVNARVSHGSHKVSPCEGVLETETREILPRVYTPPKFADCPDC